MPRLQANPNEADFRFFKRQLENFYVIAGPRAKDTPEETDARKKCILQNALGRDGLEILDGMPDPKDSYIDCIDRLSDYFGGKKSVLVKRRDFLRATQTASESVTQFACRIRRLGAECNFGAMSLELQRDIFVSGVKDNRLGEKLLNEDHTKLNFNDAVTIAENFERACLDRRQIHSKESTSSVAGNVNRGNKPFQKPNQSFSSAKPQQPWRNNNGSSGSNSSFNRPQFQSNNNQSNARCYRCDSAQHLASSKDCPARKAQCKTCNRVGHYAKCCTPLGKPNNSAPNAAKFQRSKSVHQTGQSAPKEQDDTGEDEIYHITIANADNNSPKGLEIRTVSIDAESIPALIDTGAQRNILPLHFYPSVKTKPTSIKVHAFGGYQLNVKGIATLSVEYKDSISEAKFIVIEEDGDHQSKFALFGTELCRALGMLDEIAKVNSVQSLWINSRRVRHYLAVLDALKISSTKSRWTKR